MPIDPKVLEETRQKYGPDVVPLEAAGETVVVKSPSRQAYSRYREYLLDDRKRGQANEALLADCIVWPPGGAEREAIFDRKPALLDKFANTLVEMAGGGAEVKKC